MPSSLESPGPRFVTLIGPQEGPQFDFVHSPCQDHFFGGARGGGKTAAVLFHFVAKAKKAYEETGAKGYSGIVVRRNGKQLEDIISDGKKFFCILTQMAQWEEAKRRFVFDESLGNAVLSFSHLERDDHAMNFQGRNLQWLCVEEMGQFASPTPIDLIRASLRSSAGAKVYFVATGNPGGLGHSWIKKRYIDPAPPGTPFTITKRFGDRVAKTTRLYTPSLLSDNKMMGVNDPGYLDRLIATTHPDVLKAWVAGDWDGSMVGGMFSDVWNGRRNVLKPFKIPSSWSVFRSYDWGSAKPFSIGWWALTNDESVTMADGSTRCFPRDTMIRIGEYYGASKTSTNEGLNMLEPDIVAETARQEALLVEYHGVKPDAGPADHSIFDTGAYGVAPTAAWEKEGIRWVKADKAPGSRIHRWQLMRSRIAEGAKERPEAPAMFIFDTCRDWIRLVPELPRDTKKPEDLDTQAEDHAADETGYATLHAGNRPRMWTTKSGLG